MTRRGKYWKSDPERKKKAEEKRERRQRRNQSLASYKRMITSSERR